jgi:hypothetical protein
MKKGAPFQGAFLFFARFFIGPVWLIRSEKVVDGIVKLYESPGKAGGLLRII